jgi:hypothetical protein
MHQQHGNAKEEILDTFSAPVLSLSQIFPNS